MKYYVARDFKGDLCIIGAFGFVPAEAIAPAPEGAGTEDGDCIDQVGDSFVLNLERKAAKAKAEADKIEAEKQKAEAENALKEKIKAIKKSDLSDVNKIADVVLDLIKAAGIK